MFSNHQFDLIYIIQGENAEEQMGLCVAVSSDGSTIVCGGTNGNWNGVAETLVLLVDFGIGTLCKKVRFGQVEKLLLLLIEQLSVCHLLFLLMDSMW